jgi:5-methylcytosine-specific restriction endonuclease McrA
VSERRSAARRSPFAGNAGQGSKWIRKEKRLAIYERDGWRCVWCCAAVLDGPSLGAAPAGTTARLATLDHFLTRARGGGNEASNLVTCCASCNAERENRSALEWAALLEQRHGAGLAELLDRVITRLDTPLAKRAKGRAA